jgi:hypothetical protein
MLLKLFTHIFVAYIPKPIERDLNSTESIVSILFTFYTTI